MTDADIDGSHIRTLLLTFFYRYMPEIVTNGYLYIAQPPLYKVKIGSHEVYLKDDRALREHIINSAINHAIVHSGEGSISGNDLKDITERVLDFANLINQIPAKMPTMFFEAMAIVGLNRETFATFESTSAIIEKLQSAIRLLSDKTQDVEFVVKLGSVDDGEVNTIMVSSIWRNVEDKYIISEDIVSMPEFVRVCQYRHIDIVRSFISKNGEMVVGNDTYKFYNAVSFSDIVNVIGKRGLMIQRFKGLGEMNAEQLWETTLNKESRTLLKVVVSDAEVADAVFSKLMGEDVEPRRDFIISNALSVSNIDV